jgi:hypothetical protein
MGSITLHAAWSLQFKICDWRHGLLMIAGAFAAVGYGIGGWAAQRAREERDAAIAETQRFVYQYKGLEKVIARSLRETRGER